MFRALGAPMLTGMAVLGVLAITAGGGAEETRTRSITSLRRTSAPKILVFGGRSEARTPVSPEAMPGPAPLDAAVLREALQGLGGSKPMSGTFNLSVPYLALNPRSPYTPGRGYLLFFKPDYVFPVFKSLDKDDSHPATAEFSTNGMIWVDLKPAGSGKRYLLDFAVGSKQAEPVYRIQGPGGTQSITTSTGPQHLLALYESMGSAEIFALESLSGGWSFYSVTMTEVH